MTRRIWISILAGVAIIGSTVFVAKFISKQIEISKKSIQQNLVGPIVGTWKNETGNTYSFRPDGTARYRFSASDGKLEYLEWKYKSGQLSTYQYSKGRYSLGWISRRVLMDDNPTNRFPVVDFSPTHFKLRSDDGSEFIFTATEDKEIESAK